MLTAQTALCLWFRASTRVRVPLGLGARHHPDSERKPAQGPFFHVVHIWQKWLNRRSQQRSMPWTRFLRLLARYPLPRMTAAHFATGG